MICVIDRRVFADPHGLPCQHCFCKACIDTWLDQNSVCPLCKKEVTGPAMRNTTIKSVLDALDVKCSHSECGWEGKYGQFESHIARECMFEVVACPLECGERLLRAAVQDHMRGCPMNRPEIIVGLRQETKQLGEKLGALESKLAEAQKTSLDQTAKLGELEGRLASLQGERDAQAELITKLEKQLLMAQVVGISTEGQQKDGTPPCCSLGHPMRQCGFDPHTELIKNCDLCHNLISHRDLRWHCLICDYSACKHCYPM